MAFDVHLDTGDALAAAERLRTLDAELGPALSDDIPAEVAARIASRAAIYDPPPVPRYRRSGALGASWFARREGRGRWTAGSSSRIARYVRGTANRGPAWMHVGRWTSWRDVVHSQANPAALLDRIRAVMLEVKRRVLG